MFGWFKKEHNLAKEAVMSALCEKLPNGVIADRVEAHIEGSMIAAHVFSTGGKIYSTGYMPIPSEEDSIKYLHSLDEKQVAERLAAMYDFTIIPVNICS